MESHKNLTHDKILEDHTSPKKINVASEKKLLNSNSEV